MALGAWLLLFQSNLAPGGVGGPGGVETLTTFAPNLLPLGGFHDSFTHEVAKENVQALFLGANGSSFISTTTITTGHTHCEGAESALLWRQIQTFLFVNNFNGFFTLGSSPDEALDSLPIDQTVETDLALVRLWLDPIQAAAVVPRVRVSNDAAAPVNAHLSLYFYEPDGTLIATAAPAFAWDTSTVRARVWLDGAPLDLRAAGLDPDLTTRRPLLVRVAGYMDSTAEQAALHELAFGVVS